jgi:hypothetical protein
MKLHDFMTTPDLAGAEFHADSWATWRIIARLIDGDAHLLTVEARSLAAFVSATRPNKLPCRCHALERSASPNFCPWHLRESLTMQTAIGYLRVNTRERAAAG